MNSTLALVLSASIFIPVLIAVVRLKNINSVYYPFVLLLVLGLFNEVLSYVLIKNKISNAINNNIFYLLESWLITYQFREWKLFDRRKFGFMILIAAFTGGWVAENLIFGTIMVFCSHFIMLHSFAITLLSISMINLLLARTKKSLWKNSVFFICAGLILFFTYAVVVEAFYIFDVSSSKSFQNAVVTILYIINLLANLLYAFAVLWMPKKLGYTFTSSSWSH